MIDHYRKIVFVHIPRTSGSMLTHRYYLNYYKNRLSQSDFMNKYVNYSGKHQTVDGYKQWYDLDYYTLFTIVRNPWERAWSCYTRLIESAWISISFEDWLKSSFRRRN